MDFKKFIDFTFENSSANIRYRILRDIYDEPTDTDKDLSMSFDMISKHQVLSERENK